MFLSGKIVHEWEIAITPPCDVGNSSTFFHHHTGHFLSLISMKHVQTCIKIIIVFDGRPFLTFIRTCITFQLWRTQPRSHEKQQTFWVVPTSAANSVIHFHFLCVPKRDSVWFQEWGKENVNVTLQSNENQMRNVTATTGSLVQTTWNKLTVCME